MTVPTAPTIAQAAPPATPQTGPAVDQSVTIGGKVYTLTPPPVGMFREREKYILSLRSNPFDALALIPAGMPDVQRERLTAQICREAASPRLQIVTLDEEAAFDGSLHGIGWGFWQALRTHHPEINSVEAALALMSEAGREAQADIQRAMEAAKHAEAAAPAAPPSFSFAEPANGSAAAQAAPAAASGPSPAVPPPVAAQATPAAPGGVREAPTRPSVVQAANDLATL